MANPSKARSIFTMDDQEDQRSQKVYRARGMTDQCTGDHVFHHHTVLCYMPSRHMEYSICYVSLVDARPSNN